MGWLNKIRDKRKNRKISNQSQNNDTSYLNGLNLGNQESHSAMNLSGVYSCVNIISNTISKIPFYVIDTITKEHIDNTMMHNILNVKPNRYMTATVFKKLLISSLLLNGNAYALPIWNGLKLKSLLPIKSENVQIYVDGNEVEKKVFYIITINDKQVIYRYDEIIHLKMYTQDGIHGISPLTYARLVTSVGLNQEEYQNSFYKNGGRPSGVLKVDTDLSGKKIEVGKDKDGQPIVKSYKSIVSEEWEKAYSGSNNAYRTPVLDNGLDYKTIDQISPADMDFVNSKTTNLEDIARFFNVPGYKLSVGKQTYSNNEQAQIDYITNCIVPLLQQIEEEFSQKLLLDSDLNKGYNIKGNIEVELRGDTDSQANWLKNMLQSGLYNRNTARGYLNMPKVEDEYGDTYFIGPNYTPIDSMMKGQTVGDLTPNPISEQNPSNDTTTKPKEGENNE